MLRIMQSDVRESENDEIQWALCTEDHIAADGKIWQLASKKAKSAEQQAARTRAHAGGQPCRHPQPPLSTKPNQSMRATPG